MKTIYALLDAVQTRPGMHLSNVTYSNLIDFISGLECGAVGNESMEREEPPFSGFGEYVAKSLGRAHERDPHFEWTITKRTFLLQGETWKFGGYDWRRFIAEAATQESDRWDLFFKLLHEYRKTPGKHPLNTQN